MALALAACGQEASQQQQAAPPPPLVTAITVQSAAVPNIIELPGRIEAIRTAEVRARTDGIVEARLYREGTDVAEGQPLFRIDQRDYRAQVQQAQAALARRRRRGSMRRRSCAGISRWCPNGRLAPRNSTRPRPRCVRPMPASPMPRARPVARQLQLSYTIVRAPIAGRVGRAQVTEGALVSATQATPLTQVDQMSPIYAVFTQSSAALSELIQQARSGGLALPDLSHITVRLTLEDGPTMARPASSTLPGRPSTRRRAASSCVPASQSDRGPCCPASSSGACQRRDDPQRHIGAAACGTVEQSGGLRDGRRRIGHGPGASGNAGRTGWQQLGDPVGAEARREGHHRGLAESSTRPEGPIEQPGQPGGAQAQVSRANSPQRPADRRSRAS